MEHVARARNGTYINTLEISPVFVPSLAFGSYHLSLGSWEAWEAFSSFCIATCTSLHSQMRQVCVLAGIIGV